MAVPVCEENSKVNWSLSAQGHTYDEVLINNVRKYPVLYDFRHRCYHVTKHKDVAWKAILQILNNMGLNCSDYSSLSKRWNYLRSYYHRLKKTVKTESSSAEASATVQWPYFQMMAFIDDFSNKQSSVSPPALSESSTEYSTSATSIHSGMTYSSSSCDEDDEEEDDDDDDDDDAQAYYDKIMDHVITTSRIVQQIGVGVRPLVQPKQSVEQAFCEFLTCSLKEMDHKKKMQAMRDITLLITS